MPAAKPTTGDLDGKVHELSREEAKAVLDRQARRYLHVSGEEFLRRWDAGEYTKDADRSDVRRVAMLIELGR